MITLDSTHEEVLREMERLRTFYALKHTMRYRSTRDTSVHSESVAEHLYAMQVLARYFLPLEDPERRFERDRIYELMLFHEIGEIETGDIIFHLKTDANRAEERKAAERVAQKMPPEIGELALARFLEFDDYESPEAHFADAIDKIEPIFELYEGPTLTTWKKHGVDRATAVGSKRQATETYPYMRKFLDAWEARAVSLGVFPE